MDRDIKAKIAGVILLMLFTLAFGVAGYMIIEHWNFLDALYMTIITLATIGYGETHPLSDPGRIFTIVLIFEGIGIMAYAFSTFTALIVDGHLTNAFRRKKMQHKIKDLKGHYIICAATRTGMTIAAELKQTGRQFVIIEPSQEQVQELLEDGYLAVLGDPTSDKAMHEAGVYEAAGVFCCMDNDKDNAFTALTARLLRQELRIVTSQHSPEVQQKLLRSGANATVNESHIGGMRMASEMVRPSTVGFLDMMLRDQRSDYRFEDVTVPQIKGTIALSDARDLKDGPQIVAVKNLRDNTYSISPDAGMKLDGGSALITLGTQTQIKNLANWLAEKAR